MRTRGSWKPGYCATPSPTPLGIYWQDLVAWQGIYDGLNGARWLECSHARNDPCSCGGGTSIERYVRCGVDRDGNLRILAIALPTNRVIGRVPQSLLAQLSSLRLVNLGNTLGVDTPNDNSLRPPFGEDCLSIPQCGSPDVQCVFINSGVDVCATASPTPISLNLNDLISWQIMYNSMNGGSWVTCNSFDDPCNALGCDDVRNDRYVTCGIVEGQLRITQIVMRNNDLYGFFPLTALQDKFTALEVMDLSNAGALRLHRNVLTNGPACFGLPRCYTVMSCDFSNTGVGPLTGPGCETPPPTTPGLINDDLLAWQSLYDSLNGNAWIQCRGARDDPCTGCNPEFINSGVGVSEGEGEGPADGILNGVTCSGTRITKIVLRQNNLDGTVPVAALAYMEGLNTLNLANLFGITSVGANRLYNSPCVAYPPCLNPSIAECNFFQTGSSLCPFATQSPTTLERLNIENLLVWQAVYDALKGDNWARCAGLRDTPCACDSVRCAAFDGELWLTRLDLRNNRLVGWVPDRAIATLDHLRFLDFSSGITNPNANVLLNTLCLDIPRCSQSGVGCYFSGSGGVELCDTSSASPTQQPSASPTTEPVTSMPTNLPTLQPIEIVDDTFNPTNSPTRPTRRPTRPTHAPTRPHLAAPRCPRPP